MAATSVRIGRNNVHTYFRSSAGTFSLTDKLSDINQVSVSLDNAPVDLDAYDYAAKAARYGVDSFSAQINQWFAPDNAIYRLVVNSWRTKTTGWLLIVAGDDVNAGAKNFYIQALVIVPGPAWPTGATTDALNGQLRFSLADGNKLATNFDLVAYPATL